MRSLITYYSHGGITDKAVKMFADALREKGEVTVQRLIPKAEPGSFLGRCVEAFKRRRAVLSEKVEYDASKYDLILVSSPVWFFSPAPALNTFLDNVNGLSGKKTAVLLTSASRIGAKRCSDAMKLVLSSNGASTIETICIPNSSNCNANLIASSMKRIQA